MNEKLKLCPFCGKGGHLQKNPYADKYYIKCLNIKCKIKPMTDEHYKSQQEAIKAWNRRA